MLSEGLERLDASLDRLSLEKRLQIEAEHLKRIKVPRTLRLYVAPGDGAIRINTRVINDENTADTCRFWDIVKRVIVAANTNIPVLSEAVDAEGNAIPHEETVAEYSEDASLADLYEWTKECGGEAFVVSRKAEWRNIQLIIKLANPRQIYKLHRSIALLFNKYSDTKPNIIKDFYRYINNKKLNDYSTSDVTCDEKLEAALGVSKFNFNEIASIVDRLVEPCGCCVINVDLKEAQAWDIRVECDDLSQMPVLYPKAVQEMEKKIEATCTNIRQASERIGLFEEFIEDPIFFINRRIALESDCLGMQTGFYDDLNVQAAVFELIKRHDK